MDAPGAPSDVEESRRLGRDARHLDDCRSSSELWGDEVAPLGPGPVLDVDTSGPVDVAEVATSCRALLRY